MRMETADWTSENIEKIGELFPNVITEARGEDGELKKAINFEALRQELSADVLEGDEAYEFTWVGKKAAMVEANRPIRKTLRPCKEESKDWETTENLYIEGDNLDVLKMLQESYLSEVKMIYIDPPYNTGHDFIYNDNFEMDKVDYEDQIGLFDEEENKNYKENTSQNPRFHSDWCSMIYPRLKLARNLLSSDGIIFISIDDSEAAQLRKICDEVFGPTNFIAQLIWERAYAPKNDAKFISNSHDYVLMYANNLPHFIIGRLERTDEANARYINPDNDPRGVWKPSDLSVKTYNSASDYPITTPSGRVVEPPAGRCWRLSKKAFFERLKDNRIWFGPDGNSVPSIKRFLSELKFTGMSPTSILFYKTVGHSQEGAKEVVSLFDGQGFFNGPKPVRLLTHLLTLANLNEDSIVMDFFSGSATTAHAVMQLNAEDGGNRKFIMVQLQEETDPNSEAYKAGFKNICEIGKERIRRAGEKIKAEIEESSTQLELGQAPKEVPDIGFRVFKLDEGNMKDVYYSAQDTTQDLLGSLKSNIKEDRIDLDLLFGCLLDWGLPLSMPHSSEQIDGCTVHSYNDGDLMACFDEKVPESAIKAIARRQPLRVVFRDSSFASSPEKINVEEIFKLLAPNTQVRVL